MRASARARRRAAGSFAGRRRRLWRARHPELDGAIDLAIIALVAAQPELQPAADQRNDAESAVAVAADHLIAAALALAAAVATYRVALRDRRDDELPF